MLKVGIITKNPEAQVNLDKDLYIKLAEKFKKIYVIDLSLENKKKINFPKNFIYLKPNNFNDIKKIFSRNKFLCFNFLAPRYYNLKLFLILKKFDIKHFFLMRSGTLKMNEDLFIQRKNKFNFYLIILRKLIFKILIILNLINNYEVLFISQKIKKKFYHSKRNQMLNKYFSTHRFFLYKKIIAINDKTYDLNNKYKNIKAKKIITFIDTTLNEPDKVPYTYKPNHRQKILFYEKLRKFLKLLSKKYNKKIIICVHPKTSKKEEYTYFKGMKCLRYKSSEIIKKSFINIFLSSTLVSNSIFLKKNILLIKSQLIGSFHLYRVNRLIQKFKLKHIDLDNTKPEIFLKNLQFSNKNKFLSFKALSKEMLLISKLDSSKIIIDTLKQFKNNIS